MTQRRRTDSIIHRRLLAATTAAAMVAGPSGCARADDAAAVGELSVGMQVRFQASAYRTGWQMGTVGDAAGCTAIMVPDSWESPRRLEVVPVDSVSRLQIRTPGRGRAGPAAADRSAEWTEASIRGVHRRYGGCSPFGMP